MYFVHFRYINRLHRVFRNFQISYNNPVHKYETFKEVNFVILLVLGFTDVNIIIVQPHC